MAKCTDTQFLTFSNSFVLQVGAAVSGWKIGDRAGVGCMVNACGECRECKEDLEQHCAKGSFTYNVRRLVLI